MEENRKDHWENIYRTKAPGQVSWAQDVPRISLDLINDLDLPKNAGIIDIGGGDSKLVDYLLQDGFTDITVLDISGEALERAKTRLGDKAATVNWVMSDITAFRPDRQYDLWHDRAAFHFLTTSQEIDTYLRIAGKAVTRFMVIGTFSENGPEKCSGLPVKQYSEKQLQERLNPAFIKVKCIKEDHVTPFGTTQNFLFCSFKTKTVR
ncbi:SAM-dependent methyltransferase [Mucilaginibacter sp. PPCGB 2223]|uniref:class I SAM-dependent methyltransferase n=1 Tax=Mucilaginibacter sp. PPCGB 2223 TaxID=1886027 RepID=UPI0008247AF4|nr:SAM-dependent methyltransferase [Mucilaginibacter sp. PPCGB 2223]